MTRDRQSIDHKNAHGRARRPASLHQKDREDRRLATGTVEMDPVPRGSTPRLAEGSGTFPTRCSPDLAALPDAAFAVDDDGRIADANRDAELLVGCERSMLIGERLARVLPGIARELRDARTAGAVRRIGSDATCVRHSNGDELPADILAFPGARALVVTVRPRIVSRDGLRQEHVAQIVHDLKNPLGTMMLELFLLDDGLAQPGHEALRRTAAQIGQNVAFLDRLVQELLDSCAIDAGHFELQRRPTELRALLEQVIDRAVPSAARSRVFLEAPCPVVLAIDDLRIERVVANLLANALKYAPDGTGVVVRLDVTPERIYVAVIDSGKGMTAAEMTYIFDKYRRAPAARTHEGSGLGLFVSRRIIEAHGGHIDVDSVRGIGTRFFFELPVR